MQYDAETRLSRCLAAALILLILSAWPAQARGQSAAPDFSLVDVNSTSDSYATAVSPRDYLGQTSGWYFGLSTCGYCRTQYAYLDLMQNDFDQNYPQLDIQIAGINWYGRESHNDWFASAADLPWLQDVDSDGNSHSDVWEDWQADLRDVVILNKDNVPTAKFNLTTLDLQVSENYDALRQLFLSTSAGADFDQSGQVDGADFLVWQRGESTFPLSSSDLTVWQSLYPTPGSPPAVTSVPEPSAMLLGALAAGGLLSRRRLFR